MSRSDLRYATPERRTVLARGARAVASRSRLARVDPSPFSHRLVRQHRTRGVRIGYPVDPDLWIQIPAHSPNARH